MVDRGSDTFRVLFVEDNDAEARRFQTMLSESTTPRFDITHVDRLEKAISLLNHPSVDVIVLNLSLSDSPHGLETLFRVHKAAPEIPIVVLAGSDDVTVATQAVEGGAQDYLVKGTLDSALLTRSISNAIARSRTELALKESEEQYRILVETANEGILTIDECGLIQFSSPSIRRIFGYEPSELIGKSIETLMPPDVRNQHLASFAAYLKTGKESVSGRINSTGVHKNGKKIPLEISYAESVRRRKRFFTGFIRDVTERKRTVEELRDAESKYRQILESTGEGMYGLDLNGSVTFINNAGGRMLGYQPAELIGQNMHELVHNRLKDGAPYFPKDCPIQRSLKEGKSCSVVDDVFWKKEGRLLPVEYSSYPMYDQGEITGAVVVFHDITERVVSAEALLKSEEHYRLLFEDSLTGSYAATAQGHLLAVNPAFARIFGLASVDEAKRISFESLYPEPKNWREFLELLQRQGKLESHEAEMRRVDGQPVFIIENCVGAFDRNGRLIEIKGYLIDDTKRKELERQFIQAQKMEAIGQLAGGVAHDFNNLLMAIGGYAELLLSQLAGNHPFRRIVLEMQNVVSQGANLTRQLLAFSRKQVLLPKIMDLNRAITKMQDMLRRLIGEDVELVPIFGDSLGKIQADPGQVEQIIMNLAVNARDAMPGGGMLIIETGNVELDETYAKQHVSVEPGKYVLLSISDTGVGIDDENLTHIFEPFFTTKEEGKGTGLGLSTVYGIVKQSGAHISVQSKKGRGTTFKVYFPRIGQLAVTDKTPPEAPANLYGHGESVLLIDDNEGIRESVAAYLNKMGYTVLKADGGSAAMKLVSSNRDKIKIMISDIVMPEVSGIELARRLKGMYPDLKVLFMSGYSEEAIKAHGVLEPNSEFLSKPATMRSILERVRKLLDQ